MTVEPDLRPGGALALGEHLGFVLDRLGDGITVQAPGGELVYANEAGARLCGYSSPEELLAAPLAEVMQRFELFDEEGEAFAPDDLPGRLALEGKHPSEVLIQVRERDSGATRWSLVHAFPVTDSAGAVLYAVNFFRDVTDRTVAARRLRFLADASAVLASSLDYEAILVQIARLAVPALADWCIVWVVDADAGGDLRALTFVHRDPEQVRMAEEASSRYPPGGRAVEQVIDSGEPLLVPEVTDELLVESTRDEEHLALLRAADLRSFLAVPLAGRDQVYGALGLLATGESPRFGDGDLELAADLGRRAAAAIDTALLLKRSEETAERAELQNEVGRALAAASDETAAVDRILESVCRALDWDVGQLWRFDEGGSTLRPVRLWRRPEVETESFERASRDHVVVRGTGLPGRAWEARELVCVPDVLADPDFARGTAAVEAGLRGALAFPLLVAGEVVGVAEFLGRELRSPEPPLATTLSAIGSQLGLFLARMEAERAREVLLGGERTARGEAEEAARMLTKLEEVTQAALRHIASGDVLDEMLRQITRLLDSDTSAILLLDEEGKFLTVRAALGFDREQAIPIPFGEGMAGRVASSAKPVVIRDLAEVELASPHLRERGIRSLVAIPIMVGEQVIGVAHAGSVETAQFDEVDMRLLRLMADRIALAITQSQAYEDERRARHEAELAHRRLAFLAEASTLLATSLDYESTLRAVARLAVPHLADWCVVDVAVESTRLERIAVAHINPDKVALVAELERRWPPQETDPMGPYAVLRSGTAELAPSIPEEMLARTARDDEHLAVIRDLSIRSYMCVPMWGRDRVLGALTFVTSESERSYTEADLALAEELARRAAVAVENAMLYRQVEERARAARVLDAVGDGVFLIDSRGTIGLWNPAAEAVTGLPADEVVGREAAEALPGWEAIAPRVPVVSEVDREVARAETVPLELGGRELWLSISGVGFADGTVYAFRDLTQDRVLEELKADFVSTVSHELRTPLAAVYGAAMTLNRRDFAADDEQRDKLLGVIVSEAERLATIVNDILWASRLDADSMRFSIQSCDAEALAQGVIDAANVHLPPNVELVLRSPDELPRVAGDPDKMRQVMANLLDNAIKYSPDGGRIEVELTVSSASVRVEVHDEGLGVPPTEHRRIFEKFYRLDPNLTRGVGGTGLGLYICRELVHRMNGRLWVVSPRADGRGSTFAFELPVAAHQA